MVGIDATEWMMGLNFFYIGEPDTKRNSDEYALIQNLYKIDKTFMEKAAHAGSNRPVLHKLLRDAEAGDTLYVESFKAMAKSVFEFLRMIEQLHKSGLNLVSLQERLDTTTDEGKLRLAAFAELAKFERETARKRQREGIDLALAEKRPYGRPRAKITDELRKAYLTWKKGKITAVEAMRRAKVKRNTFYKLAKQLDEEFKGVSLFSTDS